MKRPPDLATIRALHWARGALRHVDRTLATKTPADVAVRPPRSGLPPEAVRGVRYALRRRSATCLERALVMQAWLAGQGVRVPVVVGVAGGTDRFAAHAWLEGEKHEPFEEVLRLPPP